MASNIEETAAAAQAVFEAFNGGMARVGEVLASVTAANDWRDAAPLNHGDEMTIKILFDGEQREFFVRPEHASIFDACCPGGSAYATLQRFIDKTWTTDDVAVVLSFALYGPTPKARLSFDMARHARAMGLGKVTVAYAPHPDVLRVVTRDGPANFAQVAVDVLSSVLFREATSEPEAADAA